MEEVYFSLSLFIPPPLPIFSDFKVNKNKSPNKIKDNQKINTK